MSFDAASSNIEISDREYKLLAELVYERSGIHLGDNKKELVKARLMKRIRFFKLTTYRQYYEHVLNDLSGAELVEMLDAISTNVTSFFREPQHFDFLTKKALPEIVERKKHRRDFKIRVWSAAASTGEEIYTILMTIMEFLHDSPFTWDVKVLGTDISTKALVKAQAAEYDAVRMRGVSQLYIDRYFDKLGAKGDRVYRIVPSLRERAVFRRFNLMSPSYPFRNKFDIIFCRNVMIYFDRETQAGVVEKLCAGLVEGGYLLIGHSESIVGLNNNLKCLAAATFQKITGYKKP